MSPSFSVPRIFVINMAKDEGRREAMRKRAAEAGLDLEFFEAVNGRNLPSDQMALYDSKKRRQFFGRDLTLGEIGCLLSHRALYEKMVRENIPIAIVLEDDVIFEAEAKDVFAALPHSSVPWDVVRFLGSQKIYARGCRKIALLIGKYWMARLPTAPGGAHGYMIKQEAAQVMLNHMQKNWLPIDTLQGRTWETGLETLVVYPAPLYPDQQEASTIGDDRFDKSVQLQGAARLLFPFYRARYKLGELLGKKYIYWTSWIRDRSYGS